MKPFRKITPCRTFTKKHSDYASYKEPLSNDFIRRCGYCDDADFLCGGKRGFHIDHFRPQKHFPLLKNEYSNLVYACPYCNISKSDDWPSGIEDKTILDDKGYIDPCDENFIDHFERYDNGRIRAKTNVGKYMYKKLKLGLRRHQLAWGYEQLRVLQKELVKEIKIINSDNQLINEAKNALYRLTEEFLRHQDLFEETL